MKFSQLNSLSSKKQLTIRQKNYSYFDLRLAADKINLKLDKLPLTLRVLLENLLRFEDGKIVKADDLKSLGQWLENKSSQKEIAFYPARVLMQDFTGVPCVVDLATMRDAAKNFNIDPNRINPLIPVDLVIDHSVQVDKYASETAFKENVELEMHRNKERYEFLKWGQNSLSNFRVVPPGTGICHQVNLEYLGKVVWRTQLDNETYLYPDTLVGTDSHTTMINGLGVLGWGVGGIEAEAAMLSQPLSMILPEVIGFKLKGSLPNGATATDLVLNITNILRTKGVVNKFVEFFGEGLDNLAVSDRATIANMAPEYGATCGFFPVDEATLKYLRLTGRTDEEIEIVETYCKAQGLWRNSLEEISFTDVLELDLSQIEASLAGPRRPQDLIKLSQAPDNFASALPSLNKNPDNIDKEFEVKNHDFSLKNGDIVIAAITSCTNTSNPFVMLGAGLIARKAVELGLKVKPWVKTSLAPGSKVASEYFKKSNLQQYLDALGFHIVGFGCTTCIGNSGPLKEDIEHTITQNNLVVAAVLSGNRNFEGRIHPLVRANYLASPMLCVVYALAGTMKINISTDPIGKTPDGKEVYLKDLWPTNEEVYEVVAQSVDSQMFKERYAEVFNGDSYWAELRSSKGLNYEWDSKSTYIKKPPYFDDMQKAEAPLRNVFKAMVLAVFGDSITTDHISPAGSIAKNSPAAQYLLKHGVQVADFNSYGSRRGNHEVMMRGTFANIRIKNELLPGTEGGLTKFKGTSEAMSIYDAAMLYKAEGIPTIVIAGKEYGTGSSRDWAAKGTMLLGVKIVLAESFERIHRSNLIGMGVLPLLFENGLTRKDLNLKGDESFDFLTLEDLEVKGNVQCIMRRADGTSMNLSFRCAIDTDVEMDYIKNGGILHYILRRMI